MKYQIRTSIEGNEIAALELKAHAAKKTVAEYVRELIINDLTKEETKHGGKKEGGKSKR